MAPWVPHKPEQRLSIAFDRFLDRALCKPAYYTANQDADTGGLTENQRARNCARGIKDGQLDWEVEQGTLFRRVELKRGQNKPTTRQRETIALLTEMGSPPIVAWSLRQAYHGLVRAGFRFEANVETTLQHCEAALEAWDRKADAIMSGEIVRKPSTKPRKPRPSSGALKKISAARKDGVFI